MTVLKKRTVSLLLVLCMTLSLLFACQLSVIGAEEETPEGIAAEETVGEETTTEEAEEAAETEEEKAPAFSDIEGHWAVSNILEAASKGLVKGMPDGTYVPEGEVTRAQFVQMMMNLLDEEEAGAECPYSDVAEDAWYFACVSKAAELGLIAFAEEDKFLPEQSITREEMASLLAKSMQTKGYDKEVFIKLNEDINDIFDLSDAYFEDVAFVVYYKIMTGMPDGGFYPKGNTTRAQAAAVLTRAWDAINDKTPEVVPEVPEVPDTSEDVG